MAGGFLSDAFIRIRPSLDGFRRETDLSLKSAMAGLKPKIPLELDTAGLAAKVAALKPALAALGARAANLRVELAGDKVASVGLARLQAQMVSLDRRVAKPKITVLGAARAEADVLAIDLAMDKLVARSAGAGGFAAGLAAAVPRLGLFGTALKVVHLGLTVFAAQIAADAAGLIAFGISAASAFGDIISNWKTLTTTFNALNPLQKAAVINLQNFMDALKGGSQQGVFTVFNEGLSLLETLLKGSGGLANQASQAFETFFAQLRTTFGSAGWQALIADTGSLVRQDLTALFGLINSVVGALPAFIRGFNSVGLVVINAATGLVNFVAALLSVNRGLTTFVAAGSAALTVWSLIAKFTALSGPIAVLGPLFARLGTSIAGVGAVFTGARIAGLGPFAASLAAIGGPEMVVALAGLAAIAAAAALIRPVFGQATDATQKLINAVQAADNANKLSLPVWQHGTAALQQHAVALRQAAAASGVLGVSMVRGGAEAQGLLGPIGRNTRALQAQSATTHLLSANYKFLASTYGATTVQARAILIQTGLQNKALTGNSAAAKQNRAIIAAWIKTQQGALSPMNQFDFDLRQMSRDSGDLAAQTKDLTDAFTALLGPVLTLVETTATYRQNLADLAGLVKTDGRNAGFSTDKQRALALQLATTTKNVLAASEATFRHTHNVMAAIDPLSREIGAIKKLGLHGAATKLVLDTLVTAQINLFKHTGMNINNIGILISKLDHIPKSEAIKILMQGSGRFQILQIGGGRSITPGGQIRGGGGHTSPGALGPAKGILVPGHGNTDSVPAMLTPGEAVVPKHLVPMVAPLLKRHRVPGFSQGGFVGSVPGLGTWAQTEYGAFRTQMENAMVAQMRSALMAAKAAAARAAAAAFGGHGHPLSGAGIFSQAALEALWRGAGGPAGIAHLMAAIADAESGGNPNAHNPSGATGLWQILGQVSPGNLYNPAVNARNAVIKYETQGLGAWVTYTNGAYRQFMNTGGMVMPVKRYDTGGYLPPGLSVANNMTGRPEKVSAPTGMGGDEAMLQRLDTLIAVGRQSPRSSGAMFAGVLNSSSRASGQRAAHSTRPLI